MTGAPLPIIVLSASFCCGLVVGYVFPSSLYLAPAILAGAFASRSLLQNRGFGTDVLILLFGFLIGAQRMACCVDNVPETGEAPGPVRRCALRTSESLLARLQQAGLQDEEMHLTAALLLGRRDGLDAGVKTKFRRVGASHLLALSGLHLGVIYGLSCMLCVRWVRFSRWRWLAIPLLIGGLWAYALVAGSPPSLVRAAGMLSVVCVAMLAFRRLPLLHNLFLAAIFLLFCKPLLLCDVGFQLSFMAVLFIALVYVPLHAFFASWPLPLRWCGRLFLLSLAAQLGTLPLCAYYFHTFSLAGAVVSVAMVPLTSLFVYCGVLTLLFPFPLMVACVSACARLELDATDLFMRLFPSAMWTGLHPSGLSVALIYVALSAACVRIFCLAEQARQRNAKI